VQEIDVIRLIFNITGVAVSLLSLYYAARLSRVFRSGMLEASWRSITMGIVLVSIANILFLTRTVIMPDDLSQVLLYSGAMCAFLGGLFLLFGLRREYRLWSGFTREKQKPLVPEPDQPQETPVQS
jgi:hypothetical protein